MKKRRSFSAQKPSPKKAGWSSVGDRWTVGPDSTIWTELECCFFVDQMCGDFYLPQSKNKHVMLTCFGYLRYSSIFCFLLFCFVVFCWFFFQDGYYLFSQCHRDSWIWPSGSLVSFTGGLLFQSFVNITAKFLSHMLADATQIDPNTKQKDGLQSYFLSSLYRRKIRIIMKLIHPRRLT